MFEFGTLKAAALNMMFLSDLLARLALFLLLCADSKAMEELHKNIASRIMAGDEVQGIADCFAVTRKGVHKVNKVYTASGNYCDHEKSGRTLTTCTAANVKATKTEVENHPCNNVCKIARELSLLRNSVSSMIGKDRGLWSRACTGVQDLTAACTAQRTVARSKLKKGRGEVLMFSDGKIFVVNVFSNSRLRCILCFCKGYISDVDSGQMVILTNPMSMLSRSSEEDSTPLCGGRAGLQTEEI